VKKHDKIVDVSSIKDDVKFMFKKTILK